MVSLKPGDGIRASSGIGEVRALSLISGETIIVEGFKIQFFLEHINASFSFL
jgi:hypothetical protein